MLRENLKDAGQIIENILTQPLSVPGGETDASLLEAARHFNRSHPEASDLRKIILSFLQFPDQTEIMLRELDILQDELS